MGEKFDELMQDAECREWVISRPKAVQEAIRQCPPNQLYRIKGGTFPATVYSYDEEMNDTVTLKVNVHSPLLPRTVFGVPPDDLEPWDESRGDIANTTGAPICPGWPALDGKIPT